MNKCQKLEIDEWILLLSELNKEKPAGKVVCSNYKLLLFLSSSLSIQFDGSAANFLPPMSPADGNQPQSVTVELQ